MEEILNNLIGKQFSYENKIILIKSWKKVNSIYVIISDKRTYNFYQSEIQKFINSLEIVRVKLKEGVLEKRQLELKNKQMETSDYKEENKMPKQEVEVVQVVKNYDLEKDFDIEKFLISAIIKVKDNKEYIPQANAICNLASQLINLKKVEFLLSYKK